MSLLEYTPEENDWKLLISKDFQHYYNKNSVLAGGVAALSTYIACFLEFKKKSSKKDFHK